MINETFARRIWPQEDPIGTLIRVGDPDSPWRTVVGVSPTDPATPETVTLVHYTVGVAACYSPARGATNVDPMVALRHDG